MSSVKETTLPLEVKSLLRKFKNWSERITVFPDGRGLICDIQKTGDIDQFVEMWTPLRPEGKVSYSLNGLIHYDVSSTTVEEETFLEKLEVKLHKKPHSSFELKEPDLAFISMKFRKNDKRSIILDKQQVDEQVVDYSNPVQCNMKVILSDFTGTSCEIHLPASLLKKLPKQDYWVKVFDGLGIFESTDGDYVVYALLNRVTKYEDHFTTARTTS